MVATGLSAPTEACSKRQCVRRSSEEEDLSKCPSMAVALRAPPSVSTDAPGKWPLEMPVLALSGSLLCVLVIESIDVRVTEIKVMLQQKTGVPQMQQDVILHGCSAPMLDSARLVHYADALFGAARMYLVRKGPATEVPDRSTLRRLRKEQQIARSLEWLGCSLAPMGGDLEESPLKWTATIGGPDASPYKDGVFNMDIVLPHDFPYRPPRVQFTTKIFHPSVSATGSLEVPFLHEAWSPVLTLTRIVELIRQELEAPYGHHHGEGLCPGCGNLEAAVLSHEPEAFDRRAREETLAHARA